MQPKTLEYYDWFEDIEPKILEKLNSLLAAKNIEELKYMHGGPFKDGKWIGCGSGIADAEHRNYWSVFLEIWGEYIRNDSYATMCLNLGNNYDYYLDMVEKKFGSWACDLVFAVQEVAREYKLDDVVVWFSW